MLTGMILLMRCLAADFSTHVDVFQGSEGGGNNFPGVARPFGMVKLGPDLYQSGADAYSGYLPTGEFSGFIGNIDNPLSHITVARDGTDQASVGYYKANTGDGVEVELSASSRAGIYRYSFPSDSQKNNILVDVSHVLPSFRGQGLGQNYKGGNLTIFEDGHYEGLGIYDNGWNEAPDWTIYFCGHFDSDAVSSKAYTAVDSDKSVEQPSGSVSSTSNSTAVGGLFTFEDSEIISRVGISWISTKQACSNVDQEIPKGTDFAAVVEDAVSEWNTKDLFRCSTALMQVLQPTAYEEQIRSLIDIWRHDGYLPDARSSNYNGRTQGGSNADNILADAYVKGVRGKVDWEDGYRAMVKDAEVTPANYPVDPMAPDSSTHHGRGALPDWLSLGYITPRFSRAVTRAVEYACNDFGLYQVASGLGKHSDAQKYLNRSRNWRNHWNPDQTSLGFSGFVVPRDKNGFIQTDPAKDGGYWGDPYYEGSSWAYSWNDVHDMKHLIELMGGPETTVKRLDTIFDKGLFDSTNEPMFNLPYLYNYLGRQDLSVSRSRKVAKGEYHTGNSGLPGNSDAGAMQTWLLWNMIGLYPITGQTTFLIHAPWFESLVIDLGGDKKLEISSTGGDGNGDSDYYVQNLKVNGKEWTKNWLEWGGRLCGWRQAGV
ncbi:uncharacterized protein N7469_001400 [Penicillium citrinum]|uniref:Glycosyl hydrolase n=1 Tax=Penicillium citrinum TaxID=5077 RepID=A0A9W9PHI7_PENCI|nr:uncharacterized protein N7469_001400 [Penicillium citrinum]KAJ5243073.1 hypothetical protein N7469_001400 [Penicillium citrinum]